MAFSDRCFLINNLSENDYIIFINTLKLLKKLFTQNIGYNHNYQTYEHKQPNTLKTPRNF